MGITRKILMGGCALALSVAFTGNAEAKKAAAKCAGPADVTAMQVAAIQQNLMVSALTCGDLARTNFNAFQTNFGPDLRKSDKALLAMFRRILGRGGDAAYNLFKTDLASKAELRRIHGHAEFCSAADQIASMALAPEKPNLADFVVGAPPIDFSGPVTSCEVLTAAATGSAGGIPDIMPMPNPLRVASLDLPAAVLPAPSTPSTPVAAPAPDPTSSGAATPPSTVVMQGAPSAPEAQDTVTPSQGSAQEPVKEQPKEQPKEEKRSSGWFLGL